MGTSQWCYCCLGTDSKKSGMCPEEAQSKERKPLSHIRKEERQRRNWFICTSEIWAKSVYTLYSSKTIHEIIWKKVEKKVTMMTRNNSKHRCFFSLAPWRLQVFVFSAWATVWQVSWTTLSIHFLLMWKCPDSLERELCWKPFIIKD